MKELKHKKIITLIMVLGTIMVVGGFSYALYYFSKSYDYNGITAAKISLNFDGEDTFPAESFILESADDARSRIDNYIDLEVTGNNDSNRYIEYRINLIEDLKIPEGFLQKFRYQDFRFDVYDLETEAVLINEIQLNSLDDPIFIGYVPPKTSDYSKSLRIRLWITKDAPLDDTRYYSSDSLAETASNIKLEVNGENMHQDANVFYVDLEKVTSNGDEFTYTKLYFNGNNIQSIRYVAHKGGRANPTGPINDPTSAVRDPGGETYYKAFYDTVTRVETGHTEMMTRTKDNNAVVCFVATFEDGTETPFSPYNCITLFEESRDWVNPSVPSTEPLITNRLLELVTTTDDSQFTNLFYTASSTSDTGLFLLNSSESEDYPIYYYRGDVDDNHLIFGGFCWRIVRTTETGGTKIIYDGVPNNGVCNNTGTSSEIGKSAFASENNSPAYLGYKYGIRYTPGSYTLQFNAGSTIMYGKTISYANGTYTLETTLTVKNQNFSTSYSNTSTSGLRYRHFTCLTSSNTCTTAYYIPYLREGEYYYYPLTGGKTNTSILSEMLEGNSGTETSKVYDMVNAWYTANLITYENYLEDTVFCNDRSIGSYGGWDENNSNADSPNLVFAAKTRLEVDNNPTLACANPGDRYTVSTSNGNGKLNYPVGLLTADEYIYAGAHPTSKNTSFYLRTGENQWTMTPAYYTSLSGSGYVFYSNKIYNYNTTSSFGVRPVVSLARNVQITGGDGSSDSPFTVSLSS